MSTTAPTQTLASVVSKIFWMARRYAASGLADPGDAHKYDLMRAAALAHGVKLTPGNNFESDWAHGYVAAPEPLPPLEVVVDEIHLMARRYADGRATYATSLFNEAARAALSAGVKLTAAEVDGTVFAADGMGEGFDGLTTEERAEALRSPWRSRA